MFIGNKLSSRLKCSCKNINASASTRTVQVIASYLSFYPLLLKAIIQKLGMLSVVTIQGMALFT